MSFSVTLFQYVPSRSRFLKTFKALTVLLVHSKLSMVPKSLRIKEQPLSARPGLISPHTPVYCTHKTDPGFPILLPRSDLPASAPGGPLRLSSSPTSHHAVRHRAPPTTAPPSSIPRLRALELEPRARSFSVWWGEGGAGPEIERLPEAGPSAPPPPPSDSGRSGSGSGLRTRAQQGLSWA